MTALDFATDGLRLALCVQIEDIYDGSGRVTRRWCGPRSRTGSGMAVRIGGQMIEFEGRIADARIVRSVGPLSNHVQTLSSLDLDLAVDGEDDALLVLAQSGRWERRTVRAWYVALSEFGRGDDGTDIRECFRGLVDEGPRCSLSRIQVSCTAGIIGLDAEWPMTRIPADTSNWTQTTAAVLAPNPWTGGNVVGGWHPATYYVPPPKAGSRVGPVYGDGHLDGVWREIVFYGRQLAPDSPSNHHEFFHVSPQFGCWVEELWWEDTDNQALRGVDTDTGDPSWCQAFDNLDPTMGPVGTCVRLSYASSSTISAFEAAPYPRAFARIKGAGSAVRYGAIDDGGSVEFTRTTGAVIRSLDAWVIEDLFTDSQLLDAGPVLDVFGPDALTAWSAEAPSGPTTWANYRHMACAVPLGLPKTPPLVRQVLGDLMTLLCSDIVERWDDAAGGLRVWPRRRRPNPAATEADWTIRDYDLLSGSAASLRRWALTDDPGRTYANSVTSTSPDYGTAPETVASGDPADVIDPTGKATHDHEDAVEQSTDGGGGVIHRDAQFRYWIPTQETSGFDDACELAAASRSQPIKGVRVSLGWPWLRLSLLDTVEYEIEGLADVGVGHVREIEEHLGAQSVTIHSVHALFSPGAGHSDGAHTTEKE